MAEAILLVILLALALYAVLGGADFGAGIAEVWLPREDRAHVDAALLPVWEANHVWLVLAVVLSFVAFPRVFSVASTYLHLPILFVLLGIVARGSAFTFRHYDPGLGALEAWYTWVFRIGSVLAPFFLGVIAAALVQGSLVLDPARGFFAAFVEPWLTWFCAASGVFTCALFAFQGAALLAAERGVGGAALPYLRLSRRLHVAAIASGAWVLLCAYRADLAWFRQLIARPACVIAFVVATSLIPLIAYAFAHGRPWLLRLASGAQLCCVLGAFFGAQYPLLLRHEAGGITLAEAAAPAETLNTLAWALGIGLLLIAPSLVYLLRVYKGQPEKKSL